MQYFDFQLIAFVMTMFLCMKILYGDRPPTTRKSAVDGDMVEDSVFRKWILLHDDESAVWACRDLCGDPMCIGDYGLVVRADFDYRFIFNINETEYDLTDLVISLKI